MKRLAKLTPNTRSVGNYAPVIHVHVLRSAGAQGAGGMSEVYRARSLLLPFFQQSIPAGITHHELRDVRLQQVI
jgi:hypothetical protein